jgi:hypothetical protein
MHISEFQHSVGSFVSDKGAGLPKSGGSRGGRPFAYGWTVTLLVVWALSTAVSAVWAWQFTVTAKACWQKHLQNLDLWFRGIYNLSIHTSCYVRVFKINAVAITTACGQGNCSWGLRASHMETLYLHALQLVHWHIYIITRSENVSGLLQTVEMQ